MLYTIFENDDKHNQPLAPIASNTLGVCNFFSGNSFNFFKHFQLLPMMHGA